MIHKLTAKVQKINPSLPPSARGFSNCYVLEPEDQEMLERRGIVYTVFDISSSEEFDTALVSKVVSDVLRDTYYQSENISPVQSLEKSIVEVRDKVTKLTNETIRVRDSTVEFNILSGVLWGNVLYVVTYGSMASFLMRDGQIRPINANSEGQFSAASGVVKNDDVIVFSTKPFVEHISPDQLFDMSIQTGELPLEASSLLLKIVVDTSFSENEIVDFGVIEDHKGKPITLTFKNAFLSLTKKLKKEEKSQSPVFTAPATNAPETIAPSVDHVTGLSQSPLLGKSFELKVGKRYGRKEKVTSIIALAALLLAVSIFTTVRNRNNDDEKSSTSENETSKAAEVFQATTDTLGETTSQPDTSKDSEYKIIRVSPEVLYDIKLVDPASNPDVIEVTSDSINVYDSNSKKMFSSSLEIPKFTLSDKEYVDKGISAVYLGNTYTLSGDTITKTTPEGESSTWAQNASLTGGKSIAIDMSIYVLKSDGSLLQYLRGVQQSFDLKGLDKGFSSPVQVLTDYDFDNIYVADSGNKRIVVLNKEGELVKQLISSDPNDWNDIKGIAISADEKTLYVLAGSRVFEVSP